MPEKDPYQNPEDIRLNSDRDDIQRLLGHPPGWSLRWGITAVFGAIVLFLALAWLVKYPDVVTAEAMIVTEAPPIRVVARSSGKVSRLMVEDKQTVAEGQVIAVLENTAELEDIRLLEATIRRLDSIFLPEGLLSVTLPEGLRLGELQNTYAAFQQACYDFQFTEQQQGVFARIASLRQQIRYLEELNASLHQQQETLLREVDIARRSFDRNKNLLESGAISQLELEQSETNYLQYRRRMEGLQAEVLNNKLQAEEYQSRIIELQQSRAETGMQKWRAIRELLSRLKSELALWKQNYLIISPIDGRVSLARIWSPQQYVQANEVVATAVPGAGNGEMAGKAFLPTFNSGKVRPGQRANIRLDGYPYQEFGVLQGRVKSIALVPEQGRYLLEIALPDSLVTNYGRTIPFGQELPGQARIITEERRVLERVFDQVMSLLKNS